MTYASAPKATPTPSSTPLPTRQRPQTTSTSIHDQNNPATSHAQWAPRTPNPPNVPRAHNQKSSTVGYRTAWLSSVEPINRCARSADSSYLGLEDPSEFLLRHAIEAADKQWELWLVCRRGGCCSKGSDVEECDMALCLLLCFERWRL